MKSICLGRRVVVGCAFLLAMAHTGVRPAAAQDPEAGGPSPFWVSFGIGAGVSQSSGVEDDGLGPGAVGEVGILTGVHRLSLRASFVAEIFGDGAADFGALYGRRWPFPDLSLAAGVAGVEVADCPDLFSGDPSCENKYTVGLPLTAELSLLRTDHLGLGIHAFGNVNGIASFGGLTLVAQLGRLR